MLMQPKPGAGEYVPTPKELYRSECGVLVSQIFKRFASEHADEWKAVRAAKAAVAKSAKIAKIDFLRTVTSMWAASSTRDEIAAATGRSEDAVRKALRNRGIMLPFSRAKRQFVCWFSPAQFDSLGSMARDSGRTRLEVVSDLLAWALADDAHAARRELHIPRAQP